eukprot:gnl/MRDRNA2_/MRDRNA2_66208_c0_seq3.p1 gnl/MRDRNA2_/MRDRNA2_66208_c0~~gnl/MRDRNA2_/MRDRNA2_66208_c0_seq3.p1  ORF type:complete len:174 (-),score=34.40 gnl/MRDRNA2_/MRDRNA2_66208_c0_seq3:109-561(-)
MKGDLMPKQRPPKPVREKIANITEQYRGWYDPTSVQQVIDERDGLKHIVASLPQEYQQNPGLVKSLVEERDEWRRRALKAEAELMSCQSQLVSMGKNNEVLERKCGEEKKNKIPGAKKNLEGQVQAGYPSQTSLGAVVPDVAAVSDSRSQ